MLLLSFGLTNLLSFHGAHFPGALELIQFSLCPAFHAIQQSIQPLASPWHVGIFIERLVVHLFEKRGVASFPTRQGFEHHARLTLGFLGGLFIKFGKIGARSDRPIRKIGRSGTLLQGRFDR